MTLHSFDNAIDTGAFDIPDGPHSEIIKELKNRLILVGTYLPELGLSDSLDYEPNTEGTNEGTKRSDLVVVEGEGIRFPIKSRNQNNFSFFKEAIENTEQKTGNIYIVEIKEKLESGAVGQALLYKYLLQKKYLERLEQSLEDFDLETCIAFKNKDREVASFCQDAGDIRLIQV